MTTFYFKRFIFIATVDLMVSRLGPKWSTTSNSNVAIGPFLDTITKTIDLKVHRSPDLERVPCPAPPHVQSANNPLYHLCGCLVGVADREEFLPAASATPGLLAATEVGHQITYINFF